MEAGRERACTAREAAELSVATAPRFSGTHHGETSRVGVTSDARRTALPNQEQTSKPGGEVGEFALLPRLGQKEFQPGRVCVCCVSA